MRVVTEWFLIKQLPQLTRQLFVSNLGKVLQNVEMWFLPTEW